MKNSLFKILIVLSIVVVAFFLKTIDVSALSCTYILPQTYMDKSNKPAQLKIEYTQKKITKKINTTSNIDDIIFKCDDDKCRIGIKTESRLQPLENPYYIAWFSNGLNKLNQCPDYVSIKVSSIISVESEPKLKVKMSKTNSNQYASDLTRVYYKDKDKGKSYNNITLNADNTNIASIFPSYLVSSGRLTFINKEIKEKYPTNNWSKFKKIMKNAGASDNTLKSLPIDQSEYNNITHTKDYYDATKNNWQNFMSKGTEYKKQKRENANQETTNAHNHSNFVDYNNFSESNSYFSYWFDNVSRYLFEEDLSLYKSYFKYLYEDKSKYRTISDSDYKLMISTIDDMISYNNIENGESCFNSNPCSVYCNSSVKNYSCTNTSFNECIKSSTKYKTCVSSYNSCKNVPASDYENCMKGKLGNEYNNFKQKNSTFKKNFEKSKSDLAQDMTFNLSKVSLPAFDVEFSKTPYKIKCKDVEIFHTLYVILQIAAPVAVILFGSIDYAKAVMASDIEKMEKTKKKFPKRLFILIIFILVPILINIILSLFSQSTGNDVNSNLMYCIIKGS